MAMYRMAANGNDGSFWALNAAQQALRYLGNGAIQPETSQAITCIAVANVDTIYGLGPAGDLYRLVDTPLKPVPWGPIWHAAVAPDGGVWGVDDHGNIFQWANNDGWQLRSNGGANALFIAVGNGGDAWTIDNTSGWWGGPGAPYRWNGTAFARVDGAPDAQWISIAPNGTVWLQSSDQRTLRLDGNAWRVVATDTPRLYGITAANDGLVYGWDVGLLYVLGGGVWQMLDTPGICNCVGVAADGTLLVDGQPPVRLAGFSVYQRLANFPQTLDVFAIDAHKMYLLDVQAGCYLEWGGSTWQRIAGGNMASISVGTDGTLWGVDANHAIFSFDGSAWQPVPGTMQKVSIGSAQYIVGLDAAGKLFYFDGGGWQPIASPTTGPMLDVAIGSDAALFVIDGGHKLWSRIAPGDWAQIGSVPLQQIDAADRYHVCGVTVGNGTDNSVWTGAGVAVGGNHHLHRYFKSARLREACE